MAEEGRSPAYAPESSFGWLDHDDAAAERMREVLRAFEEKDTIDALGLGVVRDALADRMFPGTSTVQTRARYFFFVPWIYAQCERLGLSPRELDAKARELEVALIESLRVGQERIRDAGIIGGRARKRTKRLASSVYWNGLAALGFRLRDLSPSELRRWIAALRHRSTQRDRDDNGEPIGSDARLWARLPTPPDGFPHEPITFAMTEEEAAVLAEAMQTRTPGTVLAVLASQPEIAASCERPWDIPASMLAPALQEVVEHARLLSEVMHGANLLYNVMLCDAARQAGLEPQYADRQGQLEQLEHWEAEIQPRSHAVRAWADDLSSFWRVVERDRPISERTRRFVEWWVHTVAADPSAPRLDPTVRVAIQERELRIKSPPRLTDRRALERWNGVAFGQAAFGYRFATVKRFMADIAAALGRTGDAVA